METTQTYRGTSNHQPKCATKNKRHIPKKGKPPAPHPKTATLTENSAGSGASRICGMLWKSSSAHCALEADRSSQKERLPTKKAGLLLGVDSFSHSLGNHRSFPKPSRIRFSWVSGGFLERRIPGRNGEGTPRKVGLLQKGGGAKGFFPQAPRKCPFHKTGAVGTTSSRLPDLSCESLFPFDSCVGRNDRLDQNS